MNIAFLLALIGIGYPLIGGLGLLWAYKTVTSNWIINTILSPKS